MSNKKFVIITLVVTLISLIAFCVPVSAASIVVTSTEIEYLDNGNYIETVIIDIPTEDSENSPMSTTNTITKAKTKCYRNSRGAVGGFCFVHI